MITALMLLPVIAVLGWVYYCLLPPDRRWRTFDGGVFAVVIVLAAAWIYWMKTTSFADAGPVWDDLAAAAGAYPIIVIGLAAGLAWRRREPRSESPR
jgi:divalent metal cation (Fe/Co/Zn/Cd) transporter